MFDRLLILAERRCVCRNSLLCVHGNVGCVLHKCHQHNRWHQWHWGWPRACHCLLCCHLQLPWIQWYL